MRADVVTRREALASLAASAALAVSGCSQSEGETDGPPSRPVGTRGLDAILLARSIDAARRLPRVNALIVARHGQTLAEHRFRGAPLDRPINIKSASKSLLSALTGIAIGRGMLSGIDQPIAPLLRGYIPPDADRRIEQVTVGHLLSMRAGLGRTSGANYGAWVASPNWVRYALGRPFADDPGGRMLYSTGSSHLLSAVLTRATGKSTFDLAQEWLAGPLDIAIPPWPRDPQGIYFGGNDMLMSPVGLLRFGEVYREGGTINGARVVPANWITQSWQPRTTSPFNGHGYGFGWFDKQTAGHAVRFAWGYGGQMLFIVPDLALTVVMISDPSPRPRAESHLSALHALLDGGLIPAAVRGGA